jgi:hypothetical protein
MPTKTPAKKKADITTEEEPIPLTVIRYGRNTSPAFLMQKISEEMTKTGSACVSTLFGKMADLLSLLYGLGYDMIGIAKDTEGWVGKDNIRRFSWYLSVFKK